jgi:four helix bundle protein
VKISLFEDIQAWKEASELVRLVYDSINGNERFHKYYRLVKQMQGAAVSVMSNIAEGFTRRGDKELMQFLFISKSSDAEVQSQL